MLALKLGAHVRLAFEHVRGTRGTASNLVVILLPDSALQHATGRICRFCPSNLVTAPLQLLVKPAHTRRRLRSFTERPELCDTEATGMGLDFFHKTCPALSATKLGVDVSEAS